MLLGCQNVLQSSPENEVPPSPAFSPTFATWAYQLQAEEAYPIAAMTQSNAQVIVMDYSHDGSPTREITASEITSIREGNTARPPKVVLGYMSIGEAEVGRFYWQDSWITNGHPNDTAPAFLTTPNPNFPDNFKARYWLAEWQQLFFGTAQGPQKSYLDRILDAGFDGIYLDIIDAFYHFGPDGKGAEFESEQTTAHLMIDFVVSLAQYARETRGHRDFLVVPQNGAYIIRAASPEKREQYLNAINGLGIEDTFFNGNQAEDNPYAPQPLVIELTHEFLAAGKFILAVDYLTDPAKIRQFYELAHQHAYTPFVGKRDLKQFVFPVGYEP